MIFACTSCACVLVTTLVCFSDGLKVIFFIRSVKYRDVQRGRFVLGKASNPCGWLLQLQWIAVMKGKYN